MTRKLEARCVKASSLGNISADIASWRTIDDGSAKSVNFDPSIRIPINSIQRFQEKIAADFPLIYREYFAQEEYLGNDLLITFLPDCIMLAAGIVFKSIDELNYCIAETVGHSCDWAIAFSNDSQKIDKVAESDRVVVDYRNDSIVELESSECLNIILSGTNNYGHWHVHNISFILCLDLYLDEILRATGTSWVRVFCPHGLDHMGSGMKNVALARISNKCRTEIIDPVAVERPLLLKNLLVSSTFSLDDGPRWPAAFRKLFTPLRVPCESSAPRRIYCNRSHAGRRGIDNEDTLQAALNKLGYAVIEPGEMTYDEQRHMFSNARVIVGAHGAALTNMIYSHSYPTVIELTHPFYGPVQYGWFRNLASVMGSQYGALISPVPNEYQGKGYDETYFHVDIEWLASALQAIEE